VQDCKPAGLAAIHLSARDLRQKRAGVLQVKVAALHLAYTSPIAAYENGLQECKLANDFNEEGPRAWTPSKKGNTYRPVRESVSYRETLSSAFR
jgi:hypothetical protein